MNYDELLDELWKLRGTFVSIDFEAARRMPVSEDSEPYDITLKRRQSICERFFIDWFTQNTSKLAKEFNVSEDTILQDLMAHEFIMLFREKAEIPSHVTDFRIGPDPTREIYRSAIRLAAISSADALIALNNTTSIMRFYNSR